jgi:hypothetical protein
MRNRVLIGVLSASLCANAWMVAASLRPVSEARADVTPAGEDLAMYMANLQRDSHKLGLSIQAKNKPLAEFYFTELGEMFEIVQKKFPTYEGFQIAALSKAMIDPAKPALSKALAASDWPGATTAYDKYLAACNGCHQAVQHPFVKLVAPTGNPFNQSFATK